MTPLASWSKHTSDVAHVVQDRDRYLTLYAAPMRATTAFTKFAAAPSTTGFPAEVARESTKTPPAGMRSYVLAL